VIGAERIRRPNVTPSTVMAGAVCLGAVVLWIANLVVLNQIEQNLTYTVCSGTILQLPPPSVHWPPQGHHLGLLQTEHILELVAIGASIVGVFLLLYTLPAIPTRQRTGWLISTIVASLVGWALLQLATEHAILNAYLNAFGRCL
jgi:hypothetical protein